MIPYAELAVTTNFSFLRGASHPEELVETAAALGLAAIGIADRNTLAGAVRAHMAAKAAGIRLLVGTRLVTQDGFEIITYPIDRAAYGRLSRLLTRGNLCATKGLCRLSLDDVLAGSEGQLFLVMPPEDLDATFRRDFGTLAEEARGRTYLGASVLYRFRDHRRLAELASLAHEFRVPLVATNDVLYHAPERQILQDVVACIREKTTIARAGRLLAPNAERYLKPGTEIARLFASYPDAVARTVEIAERVRFSLDDLRYDYPDEIKGESATAQDEFARLTTLGLTERFPMGVPPKIEAQIAHELALIAELGYAPYFLTVWDLVRFARARGILCQGRGSAANSAVCYALGITAVDPARMDLLFERFVSPERNEPPDIDVDFEHERREEVIQYVYARYGRRRAAIVATVITYRARSALREVGKALGLSHDLVGALSAHLGGWRDEGCDAAHLRALGLDPEDRRLRLAVKLAGELEGFPRHLSQHPGGFVITLANSPLEEIVPIGNAAMEDRTFCEWDKDDLDRLGILKIDVLGLGMLTALGKAFALLRDHYAKPYDLASIPPEDARVYDMLCAGDSVGTFQVESRAQMSMLPRLKPRNYFDLVIEVAIVRPGPIQGDMVHPYLRRRDGREAVHYPTRELEEVLKPTLGVPLFQEQCMRVAIVAAGFTPGEADELRRAMATFRRSGTIGRLRDKFVSGMIGRGYDPDFAARCFRQIEGFADYGFPLSHAASFALLVYVSAWIKRHHPDVFLAALLNAQPMGFYAPAQLVADARKHGVEVRAPDVNASLWEHTLEPAAQGPRRAVRLGLRTIKGLRQLDAEALVAARGAGFDSVRHLAIAGALSASSLALLADADAFRSLGLDRRAALWAVKGLDGGRANARTALAALPLFSCTRDNALAREEEVSLPPMRSGEHVAHDYRALSLSLKAHPVSFLRARLQAKGVTRHDGLVNVADGRRAAVAGLVLVRQRPATASGVIFATLEDETGFANVIVWPKIFESHRRTLLGARLLLARGRLQREGTVIHLIAEHLEDLTQELHILSSGGAHEIGAFSRADAVSHPNRDEYDGVALAPSPRHDFPVKSRDFH